MAAEEEDIDLFDDEEGSEYVSLMGARQGARSMFGTNKEMSARIIEMSSAKPTYGEEDIRANINNTRAQVARIAAEYTPGRKPIGLRVGDNLSLREYVELSLDLGLSSKTVLGQLKAKTPPKVTIRGGIASVSSDGIMDQASIGIVDVESDGIEDRKSDGIEDRAPGPFPVKIKSNWPALPKRDLVLADAMSTISILNNPKFPSLAYIEVLLSEATKSDPFAKAAMAGAPSWMKQYRYGKAAQRIIQDELRFDLSYNGFDYSSMSAPIARLDPARRRLVEAIQSYALAAAKAGRYEHSGSFSMEAPLGLSLTGGSILQAPGVPASMFGLARRTMSRAMDPYFLDVGNNLMDWAFPDRYGPPNGSARDSDDFFSNSANFLSSWLFPVVGARDASGSHWMPGGSVGLASARTVSKLRQSFGAPKMSAYMDDEGFSRLVSLKKAGDSYSRDIFFLYGGSDAGWPQIRENFVLSRVQKPTLNFRNGSPKPIAGSWRDEYTGIVHQILDPFGLQGVAEKVGTLSNGRPKYTPLLDKVGRARMDIARGLRDSLELDTLLYPADVKGREYKLDAPINTPFQVDHVLALDWAYEHGGAELFDEVLLNPDSDRSRRILLAFAHVGSGANPDQLVLTSSEINREKSSKGPSDFAPFFDYAKGVSRATNAHEHAMNLEYVRRFLSSQASGQAAMFAALGERDPDYLAMSRKDMLAVSAIQRGYDLASPRMRPFLDLWMGYYEYPDLLEESFHRKVNATALLGAKSLAYTLALWKLSPFNQLYLIGRSGFIPAYTQAWNAYFHGDPKDGLSASRRALNAFGESLHNSFGGLPFGRTGEVSDPVRVARMLRRGGRRVETVAVETGEVLNIHKSAIGYMTWRQGLHYGMGRADALGEASSLITSERSLAKSVPTGTRSVPLTGRGILNPSVFIEDFVHALLTTPKGSRGEHLSWLDAARMRLDKAARITTAEGAIKFLDYGVARGNPGLLFSPQIAPILLIEFLASKSSGYSGVTGVELNPYLAPSYGAGGFRGYWKRVRADQRSSIRAAMETYRQALNVPKSRAYQEMIDLRRRWHNGDYDQLRPKLIPSGAHPRIKGVEYMKAVPFASERSRPDFHWVWQQQRDNTGIWKSVSYMGFLPDPARMNTLQDVLDQANEYDRARHASIVRARQDLRVALRARASVSRDLSALSGAFDLLNAPKGLSRTLANTAATFPRLPAIAGRIAHVPKSLGEVVIAPFNMARAVGGAIDRHPLLRGSLDGLGLGFNTLGWYESTRRYNTARELTYKPWRSLTREQKAQIDAFYRPKTFDFFLDAGLSLTGLLKPNPLSVADAVSGIGLAMANQIAPRQLFYESDPEYRADRHLRVLQRRPTYADEERDRRRARDELNAGLRRADDYMERARVSIDVFKDLNAKRIASGLPSLTTADMAERSNRLTWEADSALGVLNTLKEGERSGQMKQAEKRVKKFQDQNAPRAIKPGAPVVRSSPISLIPFGSGMIPLADGKTDSSVISGALKRASSRLSSVPGASFLSAGIDSLRVWRERSSHRRDVAAAADEVREARMRDPSYQRALVARSQQELSDRLSAANIARIRGLNRPDHDAAKVNSYLADSLLVAASIAQDTARRSSPRVHLEAKSWLRVKRK